MTRAFKKEEIENVIRMARIQAPAFSEDEYQKLIQMQKEMADSGFIEAAWAVRQLEKELDVSCAESLERYRQLLKEKAKLKSQVQSLTEKREAASQELAQIRTAALQAENELTKLEKEVKVATTQTKREKKRLETSLKKTRQAAKVSSQEIASARKIKEEVERHGLNLDLVLCLFGEFIKSQDAAEELARAVAEYGSIVEFRQNLQNQVDDLSDEIDKRQRKSQELLEELHEIEKALSDLKSDLDEEKRVRRFYRRFKDSSAVLEHLAGWELIYPVRCQMITCNARFLVSRSPSHFRTSYVCPSCGLTNYTYDSGLSAKLGLPPNQAFSVRLGD